MNDQRMNEIMAQYVSTRRGDKTRDLKKFYEASSPAHHGKKAVWIKTATALMTVAVCVILSMGAVWVDIRSAYSVPRELEQAVISQSGSVDIMASVGVTAQGTLEACLTSAQENIPMSLRNITLPSIDCSEITVAKLSDDGELVGISAELRPRDTDIEKIELVYYFSRDHQVKKMSRYRWLFHELPWDDCLMSYRKFAWNRDCIFCFESDGVYGYMRVRYRGDADAWALLEQIF